MTEIFSELDEEGQSLFADSLFDDELNLLYSLVEDDDDVITYSDFLEFLDDNRSYSDEDIELIANNATEIYSAFNDLKKSFDIDLALDVKEYSDELLEHAVKADALGNDLGEVIEALSYFSESIEDEFNRIDTNGDGSISRDEFKNYKDAEKKQKELCDETKTHSVIGAEYFETSGTPVTKTFSGQSDTPAQKEENRVFGNINTGSESDGWDNSCLTCSIN